MIRQSMLIGNIRLLLRVLDGNYDTGKLREQVLKEIRDLQTRADHEHRWTRIHNIYRYQAVQLLSQEQLRRLVELYCHQKKYWGPYACVVHQDMTLEQAARELKRTPQRVKDVIARMHRDVAWGFMNMGCEDLSDIIQVVELVTNSGVERP